jgi:hypothetical protein
MAFQNRESPSLEFNPLNEQTMAKDEFAYFPCFMYLNLF